MTPFSTVLSYPLLLNLFAGVVTFLACTGLGNLLLTLFWNEKELPLRTVCCSLLGLQIFSLVVFLISTMASPSIGTYQATWILLLPFALGSGFLFRNSYTAWRQLSEKRTRYSSILLLLNGTAASCLLFLALLLSSKADEVKYHMLLPKQIVEDAGLQYYNAPWQFSIISQMQYQIGFAPLHAIGLPHAGNIVSYLLALVLVSSIYVFVVSRSNSHEAGLLAALICLVSNYATVCWVTSGSHIPADISSYAAVLLLYFMDKSYPSTYKGFALGVMLSAAVGSKFSLLPLAACLGVVGLFLLYTNQSSGAGYRLRLQSLVLLSVPPLLFIFPAVVWSYFVSGYPFGPALMGPFHSSIFDLEIAKAGVERSVQANSFSFSNVVNLVGIAVFLPAAFWITIVLYFFYGGGISSRAWRIGFAAIFLQSAIIFLSSPFFVRYLSGTLFACLAFAAAGLADRWRRLSSRWRAAFIVLTVLPWTLLQFVYIFQFVPYTIGPQSRERFAYRYIPMFADFQKLDRMLSPDSIFIVPQYISGIYSPRPIVRHGLDLPFKLARGASTAPPPIYLMGTLQQSQGLLEYLPPQCTRGDEIIYENEGATINTSRVPGVPPFSGTLLVWQVRCDEKWLMQYAKP